MLKRLMFGLIFGFYCAEPIESEFAPALAAISRYLRHLICVLYALPVVDLGANSGGIPGAECLQRRHGPPEESLKNIAVVETLDARAGE